MAVIVDDLRVAYIRPIPRVIEYQHLEAMFEVGVPSEKISSQHRGRAALLAGGIGGGLVIATGGLAAAGVLPDLVQRPISSAVRPLGIHIPQGADDRPSSPPGTEVPAGAQGGVTSPDDTPPSNRSRDGSGDPASPGQSEQAPSLGGPNPGNAENAPGQAKQPGNSENAPGLGGPNPGQAFGGAARGN
ncbi:MAG: hypothetical protein HYX32_11940 [Actinobacteria bacterium]|nr:hypothetical protein [Actinomycetota bacterium]